ncbi:MAG: sodium/proline symporter [Gammaproteobacteria bacterium]|nr:sodium/proline symporter [Gammaproteobacteria bacterium]
MQQNVRWSSTLAYVFAAIAAAVGLGNIWRFPYLAGENGGGAFVLMYLAFVIILGIPLLASEAALGRIGRQNPSASYRDIAIRANRSPNWKWVGTLAVLTSFLIMSFYMVVSSWIVNYLLQAISGHFSEFTEAQSQAEFAKLLGDPWRMLGYNTLLAVLSVVVVLKGVRKGLERLVMFMFPAMFLLIFILLGYAMTTGFFYEGASFMFKPDFSALNTQVVLMALGQAFFSLNIALGITLTFSAYIPSQTSIVRSVTIVAFADTFVAVIAGLIIFPIVFANSMSPDQGPSLAFKTLPLAFSGLPFSSFFATLFFLMLLFAAFTSVISLLEVSVAWMMETLKVGRAKSSIVIGIVTWILGIGTIVSFSNPEQFSVFGTTFFTVLDFVTGSIMLPLGGLLMAIFVGWRLPKNFISNELNWSKKGWWLCFWSLANRFIAPVAIFVIFLWKIFNP